MRFLCPNTLPEVYVKLHGLRLPSCLSFQVFTLNDLRSWSIKAQHVRFKYFFFFRFGQHVVVGWNLPCKGDILLESYS